MVTRPALPVPFTARRSISASSAMRRATGVAATAAVSARTAAVAGTTGGGVAGTFALGAADGTRAGSTVGEAWAFFASGSIRASTAPIATTSPSRTRICSIRPATGDGISASTLSVVTSTIG
ncbi:MAG: hypothetical protein U0900_13805 [Myxococcota bacterium]